MGEGKNQARVREKKCAFFLFEREREKLACLGGVGEHGGAQLMAKGKFLLALKSWLKR